MDFSGVIEEIALEGLEGITLEALWKRLENRPGFIEGQLDEDIKRYIWSLVTRHDVLQFFVLPEPRPELVIFKYNDCVKKGSLKCTLPVHIPEDLYSRKAVAKKGVLGCCDHFETRKDISEEIRGTEAGRISLEDAIERWGQTLVIVANQRCRSLLLLQTCEMFLSHELYCFLELIARARHDGEVTYCRSRRGLCNPFTKGFSTTSNTFSRLDSLVSLGLITKQVFILTYEKPHWVNQVRIVHLKGFYKPSQANFLAIISPLAAALSKAPNKTVPFYNIMREMEIKPEVFSKTNKRIGSCFSISNAPRRIYFEKDSEADKESVENERALTGTANENKVKLLTLTRPFNDLDKIEDDDDEDEESVIEDECDEGTSKDEETSAESETCYLTVDDSILHQAVSMIYKSGEDGVNQATVQKRLALSRVNIKYLAKELTALKVVGSVKKFLGKQRAEMWVRPDLIEVQNQNSKAETEKKKVSTEEEMDQTERSSGETETPKEEPEPTITPEEEAQLTAWLKEINVTCTIDRAETTESAPANDDPVKAARKKLILNKLKTKRVYANMGMLYQDIIKVEREKGWKMRACRKSVKRIITSLFNEGHLEYLNVHLPDKSDGMRQMIILPGAGLNDPLTKKAVVEYANAVLKFKENHHGANLASKDASEISDQDKNFSRYSAVADLSLVSVFKILTRGLEPALKKAESTKKAMTNMSKMGRVESLHEYLHYMLYGYAGCTDKEPEEKDVIEGIEHPLPVYLDVDDWRRYLPPLRLHNATALKQIHAGPGSCMIGDIMLNIPLCKIWNMVNRPKELQDVLGKYVEDRQLLTVPLCQVPKHVLVEMTCRKRFMPRLTEDLNMLCHQGLLSFGPKQRCNNMEFGSIFLHKQALLLDTRSSLPGHVMTKRPDDHSFPVLQYNLNTGEDLAQYWIDLQIISLNTRLGLRKTKDEPGSHGDISILAATKPTTFEEIAKRVESDWLPGDRRGVAGLDCSLMTHMTRNWRRGVPQLQCSLRLKEMPPPETLGQVKSDETKKETATAESEPPAKKKRNVPDTKSKTATSRPKKRKVVKAKQPMPKKRLDGHTKYMAMFDARDHSAIGRMRRIRSYFSPMENGMILLCQLASYLLNPKFSCVRASVMRDILHENLPESIDKTTQAIKGKIQRLGYDPSFKLHIAVYLAQAKSDEALLAKYSDKVLSQNSPQTIQIYRQLVMDLKENFRHTRGVILPESMDHLNQSYAVKNTMDMFDGLRSWSQPLDTSSDIRTMVCANLVEMFLHLESPLYSVPVYYAFTKFEEFELRRAYNVLKTRDILVQLKSAEKDQKRLITNPSVLNSHKSKKVHQEAVRSLLPREIFLNVGKVMKRLQECSNSSPSPAESSSMNNASQAPSSSNNGLVQNAIDETNIGESPDDQRENCDEKFALLEVEEFQGGVSLVTVCLAALDELSMEIDIPDECVSLDRIGQRKIGLDLPKILRKRPLTLEKGPDGKRIEKRSAKKHRIESDDEDQQGESTTVRQVSRKFAITESPLTENAKISLQQQQRFLARQQQASSKSQNRQIEERAEEDSNEPGPSGTADLESLATDCTEGVALASSTSGNLCGVRYSATGAVHISASGGNSQDANSRKGHSVVSLPSVQLKYHSNTSNISQHSVNYLPNFVAWVASSCLMTLARTSYIHRLNLMVADCSLSRHFSLVPMKTEFGLKRRLSSSGTDKPATTLSSHDGSTSRNSAVTADVDNASTSGQGDQTASKTEIIQPAGQRSKVAEEISTTPETCESSSSLKDGSHKTEIESSPSQKPFISNFGECEQYRALFSRLEEVFQPNELDNDLTEAELVSLLPPALVETGLRLYSLLDAAGEFGIDERDIQAQLSLSWVSLQEIEASLVRGKAILKTGFTWRRLVSRRHFKPWLVEVSESGWASDALAGQEGSSESEDNAKSSSTSKQPPAAAKFVLYQVRPWRHFRGGRLNVGGLRRILERLLTETMVRPGQVVNTLCRQLNPHILPAITLEALEILEEVGCLRSVFVPARRKMDLFASVTRNARILQPQEPDMDFVRVVEAPVEAPLIFASFIQAAEHYCQEPRLS